MKTIVQLVSELKDYFLEKDTATKQAVESNIAPVETDASSASTAYAVGKQLILNDILYNVTAAISSGDALVVGTNISASNDLTTQIGNANARIENANARIGAVTSQTLAADATSVSFSVPTSGNHLIDFWASDGSNYTAIDTSVSGTATLTYDAVSSSRTIFCKISEV